MNPFNDVKHIVKNAGIYALGAVTALFSFGLKRKWVQWSILAAAVLGAYLAFSTRPSLSLSGIPNSAQTTSAEDLPTFEQISAWRREAESYKPPESNPDTTPTPASVSTSPSPVSQNGGTSAPIGQPWIHRGDTAEPVGTPWPINVGVTPPTGKSSPEGSAQPVGKPWTVSGPQTPDTYHNNPTKDEALQNPPWMLWWSPKK